MTESDVEGLAKAIAAAVSHELKPGLAAIVAEMRHAETKKAADNPRPKKGPRRPREVRSRPQAAERPPGVTAEDHMPSQPRPCSAEVTIRVEPTEKTDGAQRLKELAAAMVAEVSGGLQPDGHDQWPLPEPEPIVVHGEQIWPSNDRRYDWKAAYYAFNLWRSMEERLSRESSPIARGHRLRNPIGPLLCHLNGPAGIVMQKIGNAMIDRPDAGENTRGPGKVLQGR
jgi:hypothetical protein